jgi:S1-C subfamily serine protease
LENTQKSKTTRFSTALITAIMVVSLMAGGLLGYSIGTSGISATISDLQNQLSTLEEKVLNLQSTQNTINQNNTYFLGDNVSLSELYERVKDSVVIIRGMMLESSGFYYYYTQVLGSGFVYNFSGQMVIITNYHVIQNTINITVTFINGNGYEATVLGSDPYADLAVLSTDAPSSEYTPLEIVSTSTLEVGDPVIAVGNPYGLAGSMTTGIVSALGRTITEEVTGENYPIANIIQTSTPINSGNSGGPLLNYQGQVVGITAAIISNSQGLGFAIPSSTILREIGSLITNGTYDQHPWLGVAGVDMTYEIAEAMNVNVTYGFLIAQVTTSGPADQAGLQGGTQTILVAGEYVRIGGDIIIAINTTSIAARIRGIDDLSTFLEEYTSPNQTVSVTIVRNNETMTLQVELGTRPT